MLKLIKKYKLLSTICIAFVLIASFNLYKGLELYTQINEIKEELSDKCLKLINIDLYATIVPEKYQKANIKLPKKFIDKRLADFQKELSYLTNNKKILNSKYNELNKYLKNFDKQDPILLSSNNLTCNIISSTLFENKATLKVNVVGITDYYGTYINEMEGFIDIDGNYVAYEDGYFDSYGFWVYNDENAEHQTEPKTIIDFYSISVSSRYTITFLKDENNSWYISNYTVEDNSL